MTALPAPNPVFQAFGTGGLPLAFGQLFTYQAGTAVPQATWTDSTQTQQNTNPVVLNALGQAFVWTDISKVYKFILQDAAGNQLYSLDNIPGSGFISSITSGSYGTDSGTANMYVYTHTASSSPALLTAGTLIRFIPLNTNTGASTLNADGTGAVAIIRANGSALTGGELSSLGPVVLQSTGTQWQIVSTAGAQPGFERTADEISASVTPPTLGYKWLPGDPRRQGAVLNGVTDDTTALQNWAKVQGIHTFPLDATGLINGVLTPVSNSTYQGAGFTSQITQGTTNTDIFFVNGINNVVFNDMGFFGAASSGANPFQAAIHCSNSSDVYVNRCRFQNFSFICVAVQGSTNNNNRIKVRDSRFDNWNATVMQDSCACGFLDDSKDCEMSGCTVTGNGSSPWHGVLIQDTQGGGTGDHSTGHKISKNYINNVLSYGIAIYRVSLIGSVDQHVVEGNVIDTVSGSSLAGSSGAGVYLQGCAFVTVTGNNIRNTNVNTTSDTLAPAGIGINQPTGDIVVSNNTINIPNWYGIKCVSTFSWFVSNITTGATTTLTLTGTNTGTGTTTANPYAVGNPISFSMIRGTTQIDGLYSTVSAVGGVAGAFTVTVPINSTGFTAMPAISGITQAASAVVTVTTVSASNPFSVNDLVVFSGVNGMTQINGLAAVAVSAIGGVSGAWTVTVPINSSGFGAWTSGGVVGSGFATQPWKTVLTGNTVNNAQKSAIYVLDYENLTITGGALHVSSSAVGRGILCTPSATTQRSRLTITGVKMEAPSSLPLEIDYFNDITVTDNNILSNVAVGALQGLQINQCNRGIVANNNVNMGQATSNALVLVSSTFIQVSANFFTNAAGNQMLAASGVCTGSNIDRSNKWTTNQFSNAGTGCHFEYWSAAGNPNLGTGFNQVGDLVWDITGVANLAYQCIIGGSPGTWITLRNGSIYLRATVIETRTSTTTLTNSTQLTYAIPAAGTYEFELEVFSYFTTAVTDGITANVNFSGSFTAVGSYLNGWLMNGTTTTTGIQPVEVSATVNNALAGLTLATYGAGVAAATPAVHYLKGTIIATSAGTLAFAFAQSTSGVDTANLGVGSFMKITQLN